MGTILYYAASLVGLVCYIIVLVKLFQAKQIVMGIISIIICGLGGYICGWIKAKDLGLKKIMLIWTAAIVAGIVSYFLPGAPSFTKIPGPQTEAIGQ